MCAGGERNFIEALGITLALILVVRVFTLIPSAEGLSGAGSFVLIEIFAVVILLGGLAVINLEITGVPGMGRVLKILSTTAAVGLFCIPLILYFRGSESFSISTKAIFESLSEYLNRSVSQTEGFGLIDRQQLFQADVLLNFTREIFLRSFLFEYFLLLSFSWWAGCHFGARSLGRKAGITKLIAFKLPDFYIWPLIAGLALILLNFVVNLGTIGYLAWNVSLIFLFLYGLAGIGIIKFLFKKYNLPRGVRFLFITALCIMFLSPGINIAVSVLVPGLGVSEIWIKYRKVERSREQ
ncbi:hypothetical protein ES703_35714 [subsurface metagenome]